tara:strand:- start:248 stop:529 length:282 start_codon:yes stop_codon:yes gene_type:complete
VVKIRQDKQVINKAIYLALGVSVEGHKELLGMWLSENEGAKFWLGILTKLKARGLDDILIACVDGLKGSKKPYRPCIRIGIFSDALCIWNATA